ncbi:ribonuclease HI family protein [Patescibacteria group bacterium]|nr:ribonuclease HI family protein [Patescibacteria group bacterium]MCL5010202.1 ribonuclease HI family protein [Patescibacteria group bacterium]
MINIYTDGGSRGNPGPSAIGVFIKDGEGNILFAKGKSIGNATNNIAEYRALLESLDWVLEHRDFLSGKEPINFYTDSKLMHSQIIGAYRVKNDALKKLLADLKGKEEKIGLSVRYFHIGRENNKDADRLVNAALDNRW